MTKGLQPKGAEQEAIWGVVEAQFPGTLVIRQPPQFLLPLKNADTTDTSICIHCNHSGLSSISVN